MKVSGLFEGLPSSNKKWLLASLIYSVVTGSLAYSYHSSEKQAENQAFVDFYRSCGHYKHPWIKNPAPVPEHVKKTDYTKLIENPRGNRAV